MRKTLVATLAVLGLLAASCAGESEPKTAAPGETPDTVNESPTGPPADCTDASGTEAAEVTAVSNSFEPDCLIISAEQAVTVRNDDAALHSLTHRAGDFDQDIKGKQEQTFEGIGEPLEPGQENEFYCKYHPGMVIYITVQ
jgi:plastocyanin